MKRDKCSLGNKQTCNKRSETKREGGESGEEGEERGLACDPVKLIIRIIGELNSPKERNPARQGERRGNGKSDERETASARGSETETHIRASGDKKSVICFALNISFRSFSPDKASAARTFAVIIIVIFMLSRSAG